MGPKKDLPKEARTSPRDHLVRIASKKLCNLRALRGLNDPLSVDNEAFYTCYRTLERWTTGTLQAHKPCAQACAHCALNLVHNLVHIAPSALCTTLCTITSSRWGQNYISDNLVHNSVSRGGGGTRCAQGHYFWRTATST